MNLVKVAVSYDFVLDMMKRSFVITKKGTRCIKGVPSDAIFIRSYDDPMRGCVYYVFSHPSFETVQLGCEIPEFKIVHGAINEFKNPLLRLLDWITSKMIFYGFV